MYLGCFEGVNKQLGWMASERRRKKKKKKKKKKKEAKTTIVSQTGLVG